MPAESGAGGGRPRILTAKDLAAAVVNMTMDPGAGGGEAPPIIVDNDPNRPYYDPKRDRGSGDDKTPEPVDWSSFIDIFGLPPDVMAEVNRIFQSTPDVNQATARAMAYIRGTGWYATTFPGINEARARGIVQDERDYRRRLNDANTLYKQYLGRDMTTAEFVSDLGEGISLDVVGRRFEGAAYIKANRGDIQYAAGNFGFGQGQLSEEELKMFGRQQAGLGSDLGASLAKRVQDAYNRVRRVFEGTLATPSVGMGREGVTGTSLRARQLETPDIGR